MCAAPSILELADAVEKAWLRAEGERAPLPAGLVPPDRHDVSISSNVAEEPRIYASLAISPVAQQIGQSMEAEQLPAAQPEQEGERRDIRQIISLWQRNSSADGGPPLLSTFDLSKLKAKWDHRFLICSDHTVQNAAFIAYGPKVAQLLGLPDKMTRVVSLYQLIPGRYRPVFAEGCGAAMTKDEPAQFSGKFDHESKAELFRAVFVPIRLHPRWTKRLILGSLNRRFRPADKKAF